MVKAQLSDRFPQESLDAAARRLLIDKVVDTVRGHIEASARGTARLAAIACVVVFVAVPSLFLALG